MHGSQKKTEFQTEWFSIESEVFPEIKQLNGKPIYRLNVPDSVAVVAFTALGQLILVRQFRPALKRWSVEFPAGAIAVGEQSEQAARRELTEETGYQCEKMQFVQAGGALMDRVNSRIHIFYAENAHPLSTFKGEPGVEVLLLYLKDFKKLVVSGEFENIPALGMLLWIYWKLQPSILSELANDK